jgi:hypothetical protein
MPSTATDRLNGLSTSVAVKAPCVAVTSANITLAGLQTIGGVALAEGDRVLVRAQTDSSGNGIYDASTGNWTRAADFDGNRDVTKGTLVLVRSSVADGAIYEQTTADPVIGTSGLVFDLRDDPAITYVQIQAEIDAGVTPVNDTYEPGDVRRYGAVGNGTTSDAAAFQSAINVARNSGLTVLVPPSASGGSYLIDAALDCTIAISGTPAYGFRFTGTHQVIAATENAPYRPTILLKHTGHGFDCTGSFGIEFENISITTDITTYPKTCFFLARNSSGGGSIHRISNVRVRGKFSEAIYYNYGAEEDVVRDCQFFNIEGGANAKVFIYTAFNIRSLTSSFTTIATGQQSTISHLVVGGSHMNFSSNASADVFYLETVPFVRLRDFWVKCGNLSGAGRSIVYVNTVNGDSPFFCMSGVEEEIGVAQPTYSIYVGDVATVCASWNIRDCILAGATKVFRSHSSVDFINLQIENISNSSVGGGGVDIQGDLGYNCRIHGIPGSLTVSGTIGEVNVDLVSKIIQSAGEASLTLRDAAAAAGQKNVKFRKVGTQVMLSAADDSYVVSANAFVGTFDGSVFTELQFGNTGTKNKFNGHLTITDGVTAPSTEAGFAAIYVDSADGDLKIRFADGVTKTIVVDT